MHFVLIERRHRVAHTCGCSSIRGTSSCGEPRGHGRRATRRRSRTTATTSRTSSARQVARRGHDHHRRRAGDRHQARRRSRTFSPAPRARLRTRRPRATTRANSLDPAQSATTSSTPKPLELGPADLFYTPWIPQGRRRPDGLRSRPAMNRTDDSTGIRRQRRHRDHDGHPGPQRRPVRRAGLRDAQIGTRRRRSRLPPPDSGSGGRSAVTRGCRASARAPRGARAPRLARRSASIFRTALITVV